MALFKHAQTTSNASGTANTPVELYGVNIPGGGIPDDNGASLRARCTAVGSWPATFTVKLGTVTLEVLTVPAGGSVAFGLTLLRETNSAGNWRFDGSDNDEAGTGFSFTATQRLSITGMSAEEGGAVVQNACADW